LLHSEHEGDDLEAAAAAAELLHDDARDISLANDVTASAASDPHGTMLSNAERSGETLNASP
jgi:hypothetical protein